LARHGPPARSCSVTKAVRVKAISQRAVEVILENLRDRAPTGRRVGTTESDRLQAEASRLRDEYNRYLDVQRPESETPTAAARGDPDRGRSGPAEDEPAAVANATQSNGLGERLDEAT
jgi:hypothetical protein